MSIVIQWGVIAFVIVMALAYIFYSGWTNV